MKNEIYLFSLSLFLIILLSSSLTNARDINDPIVLGDEVSVLSDEGENIPKERIEPTVKDGEPPQRKSSTIITTYQPPAEKLNSLEEFKNKYGEPWKVRWDEKHGTVESINVANYDTGSKLNTEEDIDKISRLILSNSKALLEIDNINNLEIRDIHHITINNRVFWTIKYHRTYEGIPIHRGYVGLGFRDTYLTGIGSRYYPISVPTTIPKISEEQALNIAIDSYGVGQSDVYKNSTELIILPFEVFDENSAESYLVWKVHVTILHPLTSDDIYIDAITGDILYKRSGLIPTNGSGKKYKNLTIISLIPIIFFIILIGLFRKRGKNGK